MFHKKYPGLEFDIPLLSRRFRIKKKILHEVYGRGNQAAKSYPGQNPYSWGIARVYKFILVAMKLVKDPTFSNKNLL